MIAVGCEEALYTSNPHSPLLQFWRKWQHRSNTSHRVGVIAHFLHFECHVHIGGARQLCNTAGWITFVSVTAASRTHRETDT